MGEGGEKDCPEDESGRGTRTCATFYKEAPSKNPVEYCCYWLETTPNYLKKLKSFRSALLEVRKKHAKELMQVLEDGI